jgi:uncharacterized RDD family membrane protein YckC
MSQPTYPPGQPEWGQSAGDAPAYGAPAYGAPAYGAPPAPESAPPAYGAAPAYDPSPAYGAPAPYGAPPAYPPSGGYGGAPMAPQGGLPGGYYQDLGSGLMLPNGTELASVGRRIGAYFLAIPLSIGTLFIGYLIWGLIVWGRGQTPAQQVLGMRCYRPESGKVATWGTMALREIIGYIVDGIIGIITQAVSFILFLARDDHRSLHDLVGGTVVLHDPNKVLAPPKP